MGIEFGYPEAAHLLRRAAARGRKEEAEGLAEMGLERAVEEVLKDPAPAPPFRTTAGAKERGKQLQELVRLWLEHWLTTPTPAAERLVLFWHGHLTSAFRQTMGAQGADFWEQFATFRTLGYGPYGDLLRAIARNPAMLLYLNNAQSRKEHPNENWARELLELYTLGPGHYTEQDIREAARAFTGWTVRNPNPGERDPNTPLAFAFNPRWHDPEPKTFLGRRVKDGEEVLAILADHPETYRFLARKLLAFYLNPAPPQDLVEEGAKALRSEGTRGFLRWLFTHPAFYAKENRNALVKSPVEYLVGLAYAAGLREVPLAKKGGLMEALAAMGQIPFEPPSPKGWEGGLAWLGESALLTRLNLLGAFSGKEKGLDLSVFMEGADGPLALVRPEAQLL